MSQCLINMSWTQFSSMSLQKVVLFSPHITGWLWSACSFSACQRSVLNILILFLMLTQHSRWNILRKISCKIKIYNYGNYGHNAKLLFHFFQIPLQMPSGKVLEETYRKWVLYKEECVKTIDNEPLLQGREWIHLFCVQQSCKKKGIEWDVSDVVSFFFSLIPL